MTEKNLAELYELINSRSETEGVRKETGKCCFCGEACFYGGHNPAPVTDEEDARCCDRCNIIVVLKACLEATHNDKGKKYPDCIQTVSNCNACSLVNYYRDCHNNPIKHDEAV